MLRYSLYASNDGFEELLLKWGLIHLKDNIYEIFNRDFIINKVKLDLSLIDDIQNKIKISADELTDLRAVLSEFNESLIVDQITQNENQNNNQNKESGNNWY